MYRTTVIECILQNVFYKMYSTLQNYFITYFDEVSTDGRAGIIFCCF